MKKSIKKRDFLPKPTYPGGTKAMSAFLIKNLQYPEEALLKNIEGTVMIKIEISYVGLVTHAEVISSIGFGCDKEAIRLVKLLKFEVDKIHLQKVRFYKTINIPFHLPKQIPPTINIHYQMNAQKKNKHNSPEDKTNYSYKIKW
ncbi:MAG: energy transducer TonB [Bacteroidota bacterium]|nr:energy transducer TonB [Bacteroidota bacterium]